MWTAPITDGGGTKPDRSPPRTTRPADIGIGVRWSTPACRPPPAPRVVDVQSAGDRQDRGRRGDGRNRAPTPPTTAGERAGGRLLRRLRVRRHPHPRHRLHRARQRLARPRHGAARRGSASPATPRHGPRVGTGVARVHRRVPRPVTQGRSSAPRGLARPGRPDLPASGRDGGAAGRRGRSRPTARSRGPSGTRGTSTARSPGGPARRRPRTRPPPGGGRRSCARTRRSGRRCPASVPASPAPTPCDARAVGEKPPLWRSRRPRAAPAEASWPHGAARAADTPAPRRAGGVTGAVAVLRTLGDPAGVDMAAAPGAGQRAPG